MTQPLIICIGNVVRGDDGVAHAVCDQLRARDISSSLVSAVGLDVAMAQDVSGASFLVIVDAERREAPLVEVRELQAGPALRATGHAIDPPSLLTLAGSLYGACPEAWIVSVAAPLMGHDEGLSDVAKAASVEAAFAVEALIAR